MNKKHLWIILGGAALGFYLANAKTGTGIYATPAGQTLANLYTAGAKLGGPTSTAATS
jgi:hypothetical protein